MNPARRQFMLASAATGTALLAGCVGGSPLSDDDGDGNRTDDDDNGGDPCEPLTFPLVDTPPHEPERPPHPAPDDEAEWNDGYLGEGMDEDSPRSFDRINVRFNDPPVDVTEYDGASVYDAELITSQEAFDELVEPIDDESVSRTEDIDFDEEAVVVVLSGFGSSSVAHEWVRMESNCEELHLQGYYRNPYIQTSDYTTRTSAVVVERPSDHDLERVWVSLTVNEDTRVNVSTDDDLNVVDADNEDEDGSGTPGDRFDVVPVTRSAPGGWRSEMTDDTGVAVHLTDEEAVRSVVEAAEDVERFIDSTEFGAETTLFLESAGPSACHREIEINEPSTDAGGDVIGAATVQEVDDAGCASVITYPAVLVRTAAEADLENATILITDGWGNESTVPIQSMSEFAQE